MPDSKITALTALTAADPANDMIPIVDVSDTPPASGNTKRISINNLLACSPSATLASATITGDLTVDTNVLKVDTTLNRVGIGTASPNVRMELSVADAAEGARLTASSAWLRIFPYLDATDKTKIQAVNGTNTALSDLTIEGLNLRFNTNAGLSYAISNASVHTWQNVGGVAGTAMTLNANGLGIGVTPSAWGSFYKAIESAGGASYVIASANINGVNIASNCYNNNTNWLYKETGASARFSTNTNVFQWFQAASGTAGNAITFTQAMTLDASGNLLVGTTTSGGVNGVTLQPSATTPQVVTVGTATTGGTAYLLYSTGATANRFYVTYAGTVFATNTTISAISDARFKENVQDIDVGLGAILALKPRKFDRKAGKGKDIKGDRGFIAQEFETVFPQLVDEWADPAPEGEAPYKSVRQDLIPVLVKAIQELTARVQTLEAK